MSLLIARMEALRLESDLRNQMDVNRVDSKVWRLVLVMLIFVGGVRLAHAADARSWRQSITTESSVLCAGGQGTSGDIEQTVNL
jgi:hypothetical protein